MDIQHFLAFCSCILAVYTAPEKGYISSEILPTISTESVLSTVQELKKRGPAAKEAWLG
eukprot:m.151028 g.151028  ORF g.151028 m.151028 type:complete len:59 (+) comp38562_c0_seq15:2-178(+)